jgi:hypothetical protein
MLINWAKCKKEVLAQAGQRAHKFTRVSDDVKIHLNMVVLEAISSLVFRHPSKGKTIMTGVKYGGD